MPAIYSPTLQPASSALHPHLITSYLGGGSRLPGMVWGLRASSLHHQLSSFLLDLTRSVSHLSTSVQPRHYCCPACWRMLLASHWVEPPSWPGCGQRLYGGFCEISPACQSRWHALHSPSCQKSLYPVSPEDPVQSVPASLLTSAVIQAQPETSGQPGHYFFALLLSLLWAALRRWFVPALQ